LPSLTSARISPHVSQEAGIRKKTFSVHIFSELAQSK
jgi:hypothetical protein